MTTDDSFKKPGAIPFKWEIRPGVPKIHPSPPSCIRHRSFDKHEQQSNHCHPSIPDMPQKLRPPPAGIFYTQALPELRTRSFRSAPRTRSERLRFDRSILSQSESVSLGCFTSPMLKQKGKIKRIQKPKPKPKPEPESELDYSSDLETLSRWSMSTRKSLSPFRDSPSSSSFSSYQSSPRPVSDAEWAGFGLF